MSDVESMENLEQLTKQSLRAYRLGRLRMAAAIALVILPVGALCLFDPDFRCESACSATLLLGAAIWFRFRDRRGVDAVTTGLLAGALPLTLALLLKELYPDCTREGLASYCTAFTILIGGVAGVLGSLRGFAKRSVGVDWFTMGSIALLSASLGCVRLGIASVAGAGLGILIGSAGLRRLGARPA